MLLNASKAPISDDLTGSNLVLALLRPARERRRGVRGVRAGLLLQYEKGLSANLSTQHEASLGSNHSASLQN